MASNYGFNVTTKRKLRQANLNFKDYDKNAPRRTSVAVLRAKKQTMIASGELTVGEKIVPVEYEVMRIDPDGNMVTTS